uniref:Uncharacterized protein n=1 Tax=Ciona intestinalis TaxID=7719 RepID=H2XQK1_CIOIN
MIRRLKEKIPEQSRTSFEHLSFQLAHHGLFSDPPSIFHIPTQDQGISLHSVHVKYV